MADRNDNLRSRFPPGFSAHRYRPTHEEIELLKRWKKVQNERDERNRMKMIEEGKLPPNDEPPDEKPA